MRGATWNAQRDRSPRRVRRYLRWRCRRHKLKFVLLQEFQDYHRYLRKHPIKGYRLILPAHEGGGDDQNPILVHESVSVTDAYVFQLSQSGWKTKEGKEHAPIFGVGAVLNNKLFALSVHAPVSVNWPDKENPEGPDRRVEAYVDTINKLGALYRHAAAKNKRVLFGGDWNAKPFDRGRFTPHYLTENTRLKLTEPSNPRRRFRRRVHRRIDYVLSSAPVKWMVMFGSGGGDHPFVVFEVAVP